MIKLAPCVFSIRKLIPVIAFILVIGLIACTRSKPNVLDYSLLQRMDINTAGFIYWNTQVQSFKDFVSSPWGQNSQGFEITEQPEIKKLQNALIRIGILHSSAGHADTISEGVAFFVPPSSKDKKINFALYLTGNDKQDMTTVIKSLHDELSKDGIVVTEINPIENSPTISIKLPSSPPEYPSELLVSASKDRLVAASTETLVIAGIRTDVTGNPAILSHPKYLELKKGVSERGSFIFSSMDLSKILPVLESNAKSVDPQIDLKSFPISFVTYDRNFNYGPKDRVALTIEPKSDSQSHLLKYLKGSNNISATVPGDAVISLEVDGDVFAQLGEIEQLKGMSDMQNILHQITRLALFARSGGTGSIFPEVTLAIKSSDPIKFRSDILNQLKNLSQLASGALSPWKEVKISGANIDYSLSPLGVGLYLGNVNGQTILSSSDSYFRSVSETVKTSSLKQRLQEIRAPSDNTLSIGFLDFKKIALLGKELQGTMGLFTGGATAPGTADRMSSIEHLGTLAYEVRYESSELLIEAAYAQ